MLTTGEAISSVIGNYVSGSDNNLNDVKLRKKVQFFMQQGAEKLWTGSPVWWREAGTSGTVSITGGTDAGSMPTDFAEMGRFGQVYLSGLDRPPLRFEDPDVLADMALRDTSQRQYPSVYTLEGRTTAGLPKIRVWPTPSATVTLVISHYVKRCPYLLDIPTAPSVSVSASAGLPNGSYTYQVTFVTAAGETEGGIVSATAAAALFQVTLSGIPTSEVWGVTSRKIYRNTAAATYQRRLLATISDNLQTTYTDNIADATIAAAAVVPVPSTAIATGLEQFPEDWQRSLLFEYAVAKIARGQGDLRDNKWLEDWEMEARRMWSELKQGRNTIRALPRFGQRNRVGGFRSLRDRITG